MIHCQYSQPGVGLEHVHQQHQASKASTVSTAIHKYYPLNYSTKKPANNNKFLLNFAREAFTFFWYHSYLYGDMISSYPLLTWYVTMYVNLASSFTYILVLVKFIFIFSLQLICASIYALPFKLLGLGTVAQLCLWLLYTGLFYQLC